MKLLRFGEPGSERPGLLDASGQIRDLSSKIPDIAGDVLSRAGRKSLAALDASSLPLVDPGTRIGPCVGSVGNFIAIGLNYADHARETGAAIPQEPIIFNKVTSCICGPNDPVPLPKGSLKTDWEVEIAFVIGEPAYQIDEADAMSVIAGYCVCNDVSERAYQIERGGQWTKGKSAPNFGPIGPWLVTQDEIADPQNLKLWCDVNGKRMQNGSTKTMIFAISFLTSYLSRFMKLLPGDIVTTGTPPGVGLGMKPPLFLKAGDVVELGVEGLGTQRQVITE